MTQPPDHPSSLTHDPASAQAALQAAPGNPSRATPLPDEHAQKKHRTTGNKVFDALVYPLIAFGAVFAGSVAVLDYMQNGKGKEGFNKAVDTLAASKIPGLGGSRADAENNALVLVSFAFGTLLMAPIKWLEDRRTEISKFFDRALDSEPRNASQYKEEPKQSWKSVLGGRAITFASVLGLSKVIGGERTKVITAAAASRAVKIAQGIAPGISEKRLTRIDQLTRNFAFETFYTALCATMVYALSRLIASKDGVKQVEAAQHDATAPLADKEHALAGLIEKTTEPSEDKSASRHADSSLRRPATYGARQEKPADFRTMHAERKGQAEAMALV